MKDTSPEMERRFQKMIMQKTGQERMRMGFSMFEMARKQVISSILVEKPDATPNEIKAGIFNRFYGQDYSPEEREKILNLLGGVKSK